MKKRVFAIVGIVLLVIIASSFLACSFIKKEYKLDMNTPDIIKISTTNGEEAFQKGTEKYDKIMELYKKGLKVSFLTALFSGKAFEESQFVDKISSSTLSNLMNTTNEDIYLHFVYNTQQDLTLNGKECETTYSVKNYVEAYVEINNSNQITEFDIFIKYNSASTTDYARYKFTSYAVHAELYEYITSIR